MINVIIVFGFVVLLGFSFYLAYRDFKDAKKEREARLQTYAIISKALPDIVYLLTKNINNLKPKD